ncbi:MAG: DUF4835 family protein [Paludibacteraceae bacterium]|nr:DUF4835 family protein [Paludibacteraceae bacterium]
MKLFRIIHIIFSMCLLTHLASAQELNCTVTINSDQVQGSNKEVFNTLKQSIEEFVNNSRWTNLTFQNKERIECSMMLVVKSVENNIYKCDFTCQSRRPIYGTTYTTPLLNFQDNTFSFAYQEYDRIDFQQNTFTSNLTVLIAYYCYLIIGYDMDSFARLGGTPYFQMCENIVTAAQSASLDEAEAKGWKAFDSNRNRYALINNLMDEVFKPYRMFIYEYHRLGLDEMINNVANARARIAAGLPVLKEANQARPATYVVTTFLDAKNDELVNIFSGGTTDEKKKAYELLTDIDPTRQSIYEGITRER